jgi:hypothetical protein
MVRLVRALFLDAEQFRSNSLYPASTGLPPVTRPWRAFLP